MLDVLNTLIKARSYIPSKDFWCQGAFTNATPHGTAYCSRGAIYKALGVGPYEARSDADEPYCVELAKDLPAPYNIVTGRFGARCKVAMYNNEHRYEDVAGMFDRAIARLKREEVIKGLLPANDVPVKGAAETV